MKYPQYIITSDGWIGAFAGLEYGEFPAYRFNGGSRIADNWEIENGTDDYSEAVRIAEARKAEHKARRAERA